tara:strand:- start:42 stop:455 length:414 start_codon:yes stop_codon:yes gene_type:complete
MIVVFQDSSRNMTARRTEITGDVPIRIDVREGPIAPIEETNKPCELPGAITPTIANFHKTSLLGRGLPDKNASANETNAAIVTPTAAPTRAEARDRVRAHFTMVMFVAQQIPEMIARTDAVSISYFADLRTRLYVEW